MRVPNQLIECLVEAARWAASADNMQPWRFRWDGTTLRVIFSSRVDNDAAFGIESPATLLAFGGVIENLTQMAETIGCQLSDVTVFPNDDDKTCVFRCRIDAPPTLTASKCRNHPLFERHTNRLPYANLDLPDNVTAEMATLTQGGARCRLIVDQLSVRRWARLIRIGSELRFQNQLAHTALDVSLRMTESEAARGDGLDVATFFLPPGGKAMLSYTRSWSHMAMLNRFGLYKMFAAIEANLVRKGPGLLLVTGKPGRQEALDAGRLMLRAWISLNQHGLAVQPYYAVSDQIFRLQDGTAQDSSRAAIRVLEQACKAELASNETLYMVLRVGYPTKTAVRSRRLPLEQISSIFPAPA